MKTRTQKGFSLIEIMVGLALSLITLLTIFSLYLPTIWTSQAARTQSETNDIKLTAQRLFQRTIASASGLGCGTQSFLNAPQLQTAANANVSGWAFNTNTANGTLTTIAATSDLLINAGQYAILGGPPALLTDNGAGVGDVLVTLTTDDTFYRVTTSNLVGATSVSANYASIAGQSKPALGSILLSHDCASPFMAQVTASNANTLTLAYGTVVPTNAILSTYTPSYFYLGSRAGVPSLYQASLSAKLTNTNPPLPNLTINNRPVIAGVYNLRVELAPDPTDPNYVAALGNPAPNANNGFLTQTIFAASNLTLPPKAVRISMLVRSPSVDTSRRPPPTTLMFTGTDGVSYDCLAAASTYDNTSAACPVTLMNAITNQQFTVQTHVFQLP